MKGYNPIPVFMDALKSDIKNFGTGKTNYPRLLGSMALLGFLGYNISNIIRKIKNLIFD